MTSGIHIRWFLFSSSFFSSQATSFMPNSSSSKWQRAGKPESSRTKELVMSWRRGGHLRGHWRVGAVATDHGGPEKLASAGARRSRGCYDRLWRSWGAGARARPIMYMSSRHTARVPWSWAPAWNISAKAEGTPSSKWRSSTGGGLAAEVEGCRYRSE
jgi:hypothetical protein